MPPPDDLFRRLAAAGVPLYAPPDPRTPPPDPATLLVDLLTSDDPRLAAAVPCLLAARAGAAAPAAAAAHARLDPARARLLGYLHRLARALVVSRAPDLEDLEGRTFRLPPAPFEPADFPDPESGWGQDLIREATAREEEREEPLVAADAERAFDTWIRLLLDRRNSHGSP